MVEMLFRYPNYDPRNVLNEHYHFERAGELAAMIYTTSCRRKPTSIS